MAARRCLTGTITVREGGGRSGQGGGEQEGGGGDEEGDLLV